MVTYLTPDEINQSGALDTGLAYISSQSPSLFPAILAFIYFLIAGMGYYFEEGRTGSGRLFNWMSIAGMITTFLAFILYMANGLIGLDVVGICLAFTIGSAILLFLVGD